MAGIPTAYLLASTALSLFYAYMFLFDLRGLLSRYGSTYDLDSGLGQFAIRLARYVGVCQFIFAFIFGHMLPHTAKHGAAVRTALMVHVLFLAVSAYTVFLDPHANENGKMAGMKNIYVSGGFTFIGILALLSLPPVAGKTKSN